LESNTLKDNRAIRRITVDMNKTVFSGVEPSAQRSSSSSRF